MSSSLSTPYDNEVLTSSVAGVELFGVVPNRAEFALEVRRQILERKPSIVAVELPMTLEAVYLRSVERLPELSVILYEEPRKDHAVYIPVEVTDALIEAVRTALEIGARVEFIDPDLSDRLREEDYYPDTYALQRVGVEAYTKRYLGTPAAPSDDDRVQAEGMAWRVQQVAQGDDLFVVVSLKMMRPLRDALDRTQTRPMKKVVREGISIFNIHPDCLGDVMLEAPIVQAVYERQRAGTPLEEPVERFRFSERFGFGVVERDRSREKDEALVAAAAKPFDRQAIYFAIFDQAELAHERNSGETLERWHRRLWARYTRNLAAVQHRLVADAFDLVVAARSIVDDNFAWELLELANTYPAQKTETDLMTINVSGSDVWIHTRKVALHRRTKSRKTGLRPRGLKGRKREKTPGEWKKEWRGDGICSYPPEDLVIENYGVFLKKKGKSILSEERSRTEAFSTSLLDGIDLKETLRNWHERTIYVRENQKVQGEVGAIVVIFDEDRDEHYPYCVTWLGEHQNESDMALYASDPFENFVGPGIGRAEYGGLLLTLPSQRLMDVWTDPDYTFAESKPERLLLAGLDYSLDRIVVYVAAKPPRSIFRSIAAHLGRKIVYIPIGQLSPVALKKIRVMHVLDSHDRREIAKDYIR